MDTADRLTELERRLEQIEAVLGIAHRTADVAPVPVEAIRQTDPFPEPQPARHATPPPIPVLPPSTPYGNIRPMFPRPTKVRPPEPVPAKVSKGNLEETIGLQWAGWIGAIVFVIGAGLLISWLYASGYFKLMPPIARVASLAMVGFGLISAGEYVYRKFDPRAAVGLFGAGVAVLLLVGYAGHAFYNLYGQDTAFVAMGAATVIGALAAARASMVSVGVLSIVGGAIAPWVLAEGTPRPGGFFLYIAMLQTVAMVLAVRGKGPKWWALRWTSLAITTAWVLATIRIPTFAQSMAPTIFCLLSAAVYEADTLFAARRQSQGPIGVVFNLIVTGLLTAVLLKFSAGDAVAVRLGWIGSLAGCAAVLSVVCLQREQLKKHGVGYLIQAASLAAVMAPVALSGEWVAVAWLGWAIALAAAGRWLDTPATRKIPSLVWAAAVIDLILWSVNAVGFPAQHVVWSAGTEMVPLATVIGLILALGGLIISLLTESTGAWSVTVAAVSLAVWVCSATAGLSAAESTITIAAFGWILAGAAPLNSSRVMLNLVGIAVAVAVIKWIGFDVMAARVLPHRHPALSTAFVSPSAIESITLSATVAGIYLWRRRAVDDYFSPTPAAVTAIAISAIVAVLLTLGGTIEADRCVARTIQFAATRDGLSGAQWTQLLWTVIGLVGLAGFATVAQTIDPKTTGRTARVLSLCGVAGILLSLKFIAVDTAYFRALDRPTAGPVLFNPRSAAAAGLIIAGLFFKRRASRVTEIEPGVRNAVLCLMMIVFVWAGTLEIDQYDRNWAADTGHVVTSVFWALSAVAAVAAGFVRRRAAARYFGLTLLGITVAKVVIFDLSNVQTGWRILSFLASGGLLMLTSVLYGKVSPRRSRDSQPAPDRTTVGGTAQFD